MPLFEESENCWRIARAHRAACLIDGAAYFSALRRAILKAERSIYILAWDINSRFALVREPVDDGMPVELRDLLNEVTRARPHLNVYIVAWDFAALLALDREWLPEYRFGWRTHRRVNFQLQEAVPGASHHQKVVVIDDALAFCGGLDLTFGRWDTQAHDVDDTRRRDTESGPSPRPYHDVQMMVSGPCAAVLGELARQRWYETTGARLAGHATGGSLWLDDVEAEFRDIDIAVSLTRAADEGGPALRQVEHLYIDMIRAAQHYIYIENQYLTADSIGDALIESLQRERGPEIVIVTPESTNGWLSQYTMDVLRCRMLRRLRRADRYGRLEVCYPGLPESGEDMAINVHAKVMVSDDRILRIGSSNLNNRSMGLDSECDLSLEADDEASMAAVRGFRDRLLAEHLGVDASEVARRCRQAPSLIAAIKSLQGGPRSLVRLEPTTPEEVEQNLPDKALIDPEAPIDGERLRDLLVPRRVRRSAASRIAFHLLVIAGLLAMVAAWRWTPLAEWASVQHLSDGIRDMQGNPLAPLAAIAIVTLGSLIAVPITLLFVSSMLVFGALAGAFYSLTGAVAGAVLGYLAGRYMGRDTLHQLAGPRLNHISRQLARRGILTVAVVRMIPAAPFIVVNLVAGLSHIHLRDFVIGSVIGMVPGTVALALITEGVLRAADKPSAYHMALIALVLMGVAGAGLLLRRWLLRKRKQPA